MADAPAAEVQFAELADSFRFVRFEGRSHFKDLLAERIEEELVVLVLEGTFDSLFLVEQAEQLVVRPDQGGADEAAADGAGHRLLAAVLEHALDELVAEEVPVGARQHRPPPHYVVRLEADVAEGRRTALALSEVGRLRFLAHRLLFLHSFLHAIIIYTWFPNFISSTW